MLRRSLVMVLALSLLLTQSAAVLGHAHAGLRLKGHDPRAHIHATTLVCGHNHTEADEDEEDQTTAPHQHDDTVLISITDSITNERGIESPHPDADLIEPDLLDIRTPHRGVHSLPRGSLHPPDHPWPIYVRHLALLI